MAIEDQVPLGHEFGPRPDGSEVVADVDLNGSVAIVTGGYSGIGLESVRALAGRGARVLVPARDGDKARTSLEEVDGNVTIGELDLADLGSVRRFTDEAVGTLDRLDLLIANAGIMATPETRIGPGWEAQFGTNHLGHADAGHERHARRRWPAGCDRPLRRPLAGEQDDQSEQALNRRSA